MSKLRPTLSTGNHQDPCPRNGTAYWMILNAVQSQPGLVHGRLNVNGEHCAIGSYFDVNPRTCLDVTLVDEVAAFNDSMPTLSNKQRKARVMRWLRWRLRQVGMPGFEKAKL